MTIAALTTDDKHLLLTKAFEALLSDEFDQALGYLQPLTDLNPPDPIVYEVMANAYGGLRQWEHAISNIRQVIRLNPDHAEGYLNLATYLTLQLSDQQPARLLDHQPLIEEILGYYAACLERGPSNRTAWLNSTETNLFIRRWDDALSCYAQCQPYMRRISSKLTREWIGCLALALAGDPVTDDDRQLLADQSIRIPEGAHDPEQVRLLLTELEREGFDHQRLEHAWQIHQEFLDHFDSIQKPDQP